MILNKEYILKFLRNNIEYLKENFEVTSISLFGSFARGEETEESDIDLLVEIKKASLHNVAGLQIYLENHFKRTVHIVRKHPRLKERFVNIINRDLIHVS
ncbi:MAG: nucleotidyltransferase domain-containing protein [Ignavibacteriota bacterium]